MEMVKRFLAPPQFEDPEQNRVARIINNILLATLLAAVVTLIPALLQGIFILSLVIGIVMGIVLISFFLLKRRNIVWPGVLTTLVIHFGVAYLIFIGQGMHDNGLVGLPLVIVFGSLLLGKRGTIGSAVLTVVTLGILVYGEVNGLVVNTLSHQTVYFNFFPTAMVLVVTGILLYFLLDTLTQSVEDARENEQRALASNRELEAIRRNLEVRVAERTRDLTLSAEIGRAVSQDRELEELLPDAVQRIQETFALYYVQIYLTDALERNLILRAGSGEVGQELLRRGHRLPIDFGSINGSAAFSRKPVLVEDTAKSDTFLPNPLLPNTRSEMAVPLLSGEQVLGVLNMQSELPETFTQETLPAFEILAGQLAAAIENAYQFAEIEKARTQVEAQARFLTREGWDTYLDAVRQPEFIGAAYEGGNLEILATPPVPATGKTLAIPISIAGAEIGTIQLEKEGSAWTLEEEEIAGRLAALAGQHLENLRLLAETERYRREAEQAARRLSREGWEAYQQTKGLPVQGYVYTKNKVQPLSQPSETMNSKAVYPLVVHGEPIGALALSKETSADPETTELVTTVAETLTAHIEALRLTQATEIALGQTETLYQITTQLTKAETMNEVLQAICSLRPGTRSTLLTIETDAKGRPAWLITGGAWPTDQSQIVPGTRYALENFPISNVWINQPDQASLFGNVETDPRMDPYTRAVNQQFGIKAAAYLPLRVANQWVGMIALSWDDPQTFTDADQQLFDAITFQAAVVVNNRLLLEQTIKRAEREALINAINQRIQSATSVESALKTAAREIGHLLKARQTVVEISPLSGNGQ